jgi:hypothetical protein
MKINQARLEYMNVSFGLYLNMYVLIDVLIYSNRNAIVAVCGGWQR